MKENAYHEEIAIYLSGLASNGIEQFSINKIHKYLCNLIKADVKKATIGRYLRIPIFVNCTPKNNYGKAKDQKYSFLLPTMAMVCIGEGFNENNFDILRSILMEDLYSDQKYMLAFFRVYTADYTSTYRSSNLKKYMAINNKTKKEPARYDIIRAEFYNFLRAILSEMPSDISNECRINIKEKIKSHFLDKEVLVRNFKGDLFADSDCKIINNDSKREYKYDRLQTYKNFDPPKVRSKIIKEIY